MSFAQVPAGVVFDFAGSTAPDGWLLCYGQAVSRTTYAHLFAIISTTYGTGDGSTTFNVPDLRGRIPVGKDNMGGSAASRMTSGGSGVDGETLGAVGGGQTHTLVTGELASHGHTQNAHQHNRNSGGVVEYAAADAGTYNYDPTGAGVLRLGTAVVENATATNQNAGSGGAHNNTQPSLVLNKIIKV